MCGLPRTGFIPTLLLSALLLTGLLPAGMAQEIKDTAFFLRRLRTVDHLPELEPSHTAMESTWDRSGANRDGVDFKRIEGSRNVLLDVDGPGCVHRIFTGRLGDKVAGTRIVMTLDRAEQPVFEMPVEEFFDPSDGPFPYPIVFHKTYPGMMFPIPFAKHCRIELRGNEEDPERSNWGNFWQVAYTRYPGGTNVRTLTWPLWIAERGELARVRRVWLNAESTPPAAPARWSREEKLKCAPGASAKVRLDGTGIVREMRVSVNPSQPEVLRGLRLEARWDGAAAASIDAPLGYFFGHGDYGHRADARFSSLAIGVDGSEAWSRLPMPFAGGASFRIINNSKTEAAVTMRFDVETRQALPANWGRLHATWREQTVRSGETSRMPRFGNSAAPVHILLDQTSGPGKYIGALLHVGWPHEEWWGEGDWLIWTDEERWPPSYHGTGSEEYFNSGWCKFDRKAISGFITQDMPGDVGVYTFHLNDAFQFRSRARVGVEIWPQREEYRGIWGSTAFWYALPAQPAGSRRDLIRRTP